MMSSKEMQRLETLADYALMGTSADPELDALTALIAEICETPIALITLIDDKRQWFKSKFGLTLDETLRADAFCLHTLEQTDPLIVPDATADARFASNPYVTCERGVRFYAGAPLVTPSGVALGALCVIDHVPRSLSERQQKALVVLSHQVMTQIEVGRQMREAQALQSSLRDLSSQLGYEHARLVEAQSVAKVGSWETDLATLAVKWSEEAHRIFETDPATFLPTHEGFIERVHPADRLMVDQVFRGSLTQHDICSVEHRILTPDGREKTVEERWRIYFADDGRPLRAVGTCRDITAVRKVSDDLRASEASLAAAQELAHLGSWSLNLSTMTSTWSAEMCRLFYRDPQQGAPATEEFLRTMVHPDDQAINAAMLERLREIRDPVSYGYRTHPDLGPVRHLSVTVDMIRDAEGNPIRVAGTALDVTERRQAEEEATRSTELLTHILDALREIAVTPRRLPDLLMLMVQRAQECTRAAGGVIGFIEGDELAWMAASGLAAPMGGRRVPRRGGLAVLTAETGSTQCCDDVETDGRVDKAAWLALGGRSLVAAPLRSGSRVVGVLKVVSDRPAAFTRQDVGNLQILAESFGAVIERERTAERLRASEAQYRMLFASNPHPMWLYDVATLRFLAVNTAAVQHYGYSEAEFLTMRITDIHPTEDAAPITALVRSLASGEKSFARWRHRKKDGSLIEVETSSDGVELNGRPARLVLAHDVTDRLRGERELARVTQALQMLSRGNEVLIRAQTESQLLQEICQVATEVGGYRMAWVGYAFDDETRSVQPQAFAGVEEGYLKDLKLSWSEDVLAGQGPSGRAIRSGQPVVILDLAGDEGFRPWRDEAVKRGYRGIVCLPLVAAPRTLGVMIFYLPEVRELWGEELKLLQDLARNVTFGILTLRAENERRKPHDAVLAIARALSASTGEEFFPELVHSMVDVLGANAAIVAKFIPPGRTTVRTLSVVAAGQPRENFDYAVEGTPCEHLDRADVWLVPRDAGKHYAQIPSLPELTFEAHAGTLLIGTAGQPVGLMFVQFPQPIEQPEFISSTLKIFATRAVAELERQEIDVRTREQASLLDKAQDAILVRDLQHHITYWNKSAERLYGWTAGEAVGRSVRSLLYLDPATFDQTMEKLLVAGEWVGELQQVRKDGRGVTIDGRWTLVRDEQGRPTPCWRSTPILPSARRWSSSFFVRSAWKAWARWPVALRTISTICSRPSQWASTCSSGMSRRPRASRSSTPSNGAHGGAPISSSRSFPFPAAWRAPACPSMSAMSCGRWRRLPKAPSPRTSAWRCICGRTSGWSSPIRPRSTRWS